MIRHPNVWNILLCVVCVAPDWTFVLLLASLSHLSTPRLLFLPVPGQAFTGRNISITNGKNAWMLYTLALVNMLLVITLVTRPSYSSPGLLLLSIPVSGKCFCFLWLNLTVQSHRSQLWGTFRSFLLQSWLISPVTAFPLRIDTEELMLYNL